eukprot:9480030-Pyramimonas_sp.AAC.1
MAAGSLRSGTAFLYRSARPPLARCRRAIRGPALRRVCGPNPWRPVATRSYSAPGDQLPWYPHRVRKCLHLSDSVPLSAGLAGLGFSSSGGAALLVLRMVCDATALTTTLPGVQ